MDDIERGSATTPWAAIVIGAGFGGLGMAIALRRAGEDDVLLLEKGRDVGGVWRENTYPGAACDIPSHLYSFSFEPNPHWTRTYSPQAEILAYLRYCADKYGVREKIRFGCEVTSATFDEATSLWRVEWVAESGQAHAGHARALVSGDRATGETGRAKGFLLAALGARARALGALPHLPVYETLWDRSESSARAGLTVLQDIRDRARLIPLPEDAVS